MYNLMARKSWDAEEFDQDCYEYLYDIYKVSSEDVVIGNVKYRWVPDSASKDRKPKAAKRKCASKCTKPMVKSIPKKAPVKKVTPRRNRRCTAMFHARSAGARTWSPRAP